jgi:transcriptional regulator with GAF, ATPase, and Fis domain
LRWEQKNLADESSSEPASGETPVDIARTLSEVARSLQSQPDLKGTVEGIVKTIIETVPGAQDAGVSLREGKDLRTVAATSDLVRRLTDIEHQLQEGPCMQAELDRRVFRIHDMTQEKRWPRFAAAATEVGIQSMLGYRLFVTGRTLGTLDLYSSKADAFDDDAERVGELFAAHAAIALIGSAEHADWKTALSSRDVIGMAKGILMLREHLTDEHPSTS